MTKEYFKTTYLEPFFGSTFHMNFGKNVCRLKKLGSTSLPGYKFLAIRM